ncbi:MAG: Nif3-like dinuclear metal center hexameric protein [Bacteroidales bacterium]|nr:Nif3-like dinuclear metal center hexameric protein [Bacteroidales bacterium]
MSDITVGVVADIINSQYPEATQDSWDNSGLLVGCRTDKVTCVLTSVDITEEVVDEAIAEGCNMIVAHHPLMFRGLKRLVGSTGEQRVIMKALQRGIALYASHTCCDKSPKGTSARLAEMIGLQHCSILIPEADGSIGYGVVGELPSAMAVNDFATYVKTKVGCSSIRMSGDAEKISRVAICTGSGSEFVSDAVKSHADAYITADVKYHQMAEAGERIVIADIGHWESEQMTKQLFYDLLSGKISKFARCKMSQCSNPIKYI